MTLPKETLRRILLAICAITVLSGLVSLLTPVWELGLLSAEATPASSHFFSIVGMFMVLFGGMLWQALQAPAPQPIPVFWASLQKFGACLVTALGVSRHIFSPLALLVSGFDLLSGALIFWYWRLEKATLDSGK